MTTSDELSFAPFHKIDRAIHHINSLNTAIESFLAEKPFKLMARFQRRAGWIEFAPKTDKAIPAEIGLIIGDAIHNLASALDVTLYGMAKDRAPTPEKIMFPFPKRNTPEALEGTINNGQVKFAGTKVTEAVRLLKPYPGGHPILSGLHELDVRDKHHLLILARYIPTLTATQLGEIVAKYHPVRISGDDAILYFMASDDEPIIRIGHRFVTRQMAASEEEADIQPAFNIAFGKGQPFEGNIVLPTLNAMKDAVVEAVTFMIEAFVDPDNTFPA